jgi:hypothetical protein
MTLVELKGEDGHPLLINLDEVYKIAPIIGSGSGSILYFNNSQILRTGEKYDQFKQFALQTVSAEDIAKMAGRIKGNKEKAPVGDLVIPKLGG